MFLKRTVASVVDPVTGFAGALRQRLFRRWHIEPDGPLRRGRPLDQNLILEDLISDDTPVTLNHNVPVV